MMVTRAGLLDLGYRGPAYTWTNRQSGDRLIMERLDRALSTVEWVTRFPHAGVLHLPRLNSDHHPLLLRTNSYAKKSRKKFRVENWWFQHSDFATVCQTALADQSSSWESRVGSLTSHIRAWEKKIPKPDQHLQIIEEKLDKLQRENASDDLRLQEAQLAAQYNSCLLQLDSYWLQRSRLQWAMHGDLNTKFFHSTTVSRRLRNRIEALQTQNGSWIHTEHDIRRAFVLYFKGIYCQQQGITGQISPHTFHILQHQLPKVSAAQAQLLTTPPTASEIRGVAFGLGPDRVPGPDGLTARFVQKYWPLLESAVVAKVFNFFQTFELTPSVASSHTVLVPKVPNASKTCDFRPINVCNVIYKIISKLLAKRLKLLIPLLVHPNQTAFVPGREISDNVILLREIIHAFGSRFYKGAAFCLKSDLSKAFDRMSWEFLEQALYLYGFPVTFIRCLMSCVSSARYTILINGAGSGFIKPTCGLRQGCALSPYLFILGMNILTHLLDYEVQQGSIKGLKLTRSSPTLTSLMYADDLLLFGLAEPQEVQRLWSILTEFCVFSG